MKAILGWVLMLVAGSWAWADTTLDPANANAYGANIGWINLQGDATHGAVFGQSYCTGYVWSANCGWICLGNGPTNGWEYSNTASNDWGVNHDGEGRLTGYAYGANIGWINFEQTYGQPRIDLRTGNFSGYAWGANVGWIGFSNSEAVVRTATLAAGPDSNGNGLPDAWEREHGVGDGGADDDGDGVPNADEYLADTDPRKPDERLEVVSLSATGGVVTVTWSSRPTRLYRVEATNALTAGVADWKDVGGGILGPPSGSPSQTVIVPGSATTEFYRVRALVPLSE